MRTLHFKSKEGYRKRSAWGNLRSKTGKMATSKGRTVFTTTPRHSKVCVHGKFHKVMHGR